MFANHTTTTQSGFQFTFKLNKGRKGTSEEFYPGTLEQATQLLKVDYPKAVIVEAVPFEKSSTQTTYNFT